MSDAVEGVGFMIARDIELVVDVGVQIFIPKSWLAKSGHARVPSTGYEVETSQSRNGTTQRVSDEHQLIVRILLQNLRHMWKNHFACVEPRRVEASVHGAVSALKRLRRRWDPLGRWGRLHVRYEVVRSRSIIVAARVGNIFLGDSREVCDSIDHRVGSAKGEDESRVCRRMCQGDIAAGVRKKGTCVPCLQLSTQR